MDGEYISEGDEDEVENSDRETEQLLSEEYQTSSKKTTSSITNGTTEPTFDLNLPKRSKIPVPQSVYVNTGRSTYLADLSDQVYKDRQQRELEEKEKRKQEKTTKREKRPKTKSDGNIYDLLRDDDFDSDSFDEDEDKEVDSENSLEFETETSDGLQLHEDDPRRVAGQRPKLRRQSSSEFGASSVELLGPSGESDGDDEQEGADRGEPEVGESERKSPASFARFQEKRGERKKRIFKSKTVGDEVIEVEVPPEDEEKAENVDQQESTRDPKQWSRVDPTRPKSATEKYRRTPSKSPSKSPAPIPKEKDSRKRTVTIKTPEDEKKDAKQWQRTDIPSKRPKDPTKSPSKDPEKPEVTQPQAPPIPPERKQPPQKTDEIEKWRILDPPKKSSKRPPKKDPPKTEDTDKSEVPSIPPERKPVPPPPQKTDEIDKWRILDPPKKSSRKPSKKEKKDPKSDDHPEEKGKEKPSKDRKSEKAPKPQESIEIPDSTDPEKVKEILLKDTAAALKLIELCKHGEWYGVDAHLRYFEKRAKNTGTLENLKPLTDVKDEESGWTPLMYAVKDSRIPICERMIELGADVNAKTKDGLYPIHIAALHARDELVRFLLFKKADAGVIAELGKKNALHYAASRKSGNTSALIRSLLQAMPKRARLEEDFEGNIPLFIALKHGMRAACQELLTDLAPEQLSMRTGKTGDTALIMASKERDLEMIRVLTDAGADVNQGNDEGKTPLHIAAEVGDENLGKYLFLCKANPHLTDKEDRTPIFLAAMNGHTLVVDLLADKFKVSVFERAKDGSTLMHIASLHGHPETAIALFRKGVPLQMPNKGGARSIHIAARNGHHTMIGKLLDKGEKVDAVTNDHFTALHIAVESVKPQVVETLLGYGAQVHMKGGADKETPLHIAARVTGGEKCALMLLKSGAEPNITMENGESPLHVAARCGSIRVIKLLLEDGANAQQKAKDGDTALHLACKFGHYRVVKTLLEHVKSQKNANECTLYINMVTVKGESALHYAARLNAARIREVDDELEMSKDEIGTNIVKLLLDGGSSTSRLTKDANETAFHYACREGNNEILKEMLSRLATVDCQRALNRQNSKGWSPLLLACRRGHIPVVKTLLEYHARVDVFDSEGRSGLHLAAENGFQEICGILLEHRAFINAKSRVGLTALHLGAMKGFTKLCLFLIQEHGAAVDALTLKKQTPLHLAAETGQLEVCRLLMGLNANVDSTDDKGQKPIHLAAQNNHSEVIKLFLKHSPALVSSFTKDGSTCAHLAATQGSVGVLEELMKFDKVGVIQARNRSTDATALQLAAEGGHADLVKSLLDAGASASDENRSGYTAAHLAAKNGHMNVLEALRNSQEDSINITSRKLGMSALHIAAFYGQTETVRDLLQYIPATSVTDPPLSIATAFIADLGTESGLTPLHMAAYSGEENVVRLLLNFEGVQVDAPTANFGFNPLHLACGGGHTSVVGLLLSRSSELLESKDASGKASLHIAASMGHKQMVEVLLGQGAEIDAIDKELWTPLICAAQAGHLDVVKLLVESGASPLAKTSKGQSAIWFAAAENNTDVLSYLMKKEHDTFDLLEDKDFVYNLTVCGKNIDNEPIDEFVLSSPCPVEVAAKLSSFLVFVSTKEKERAKDLIAASEHCSAMATELLALAAGTETAAKVLGAVDRKNIEFLDVLIECEQKEVVAHTVVQRYLQEIWVGRLVEWADWQLLILFLLCVLIPPVWVTMSMPFGPSYNKIPIIRFMSYLTSHIHLMTLLSLTAATPIVPVLPIRSELAPFWFEYLLAAWITGLLIAEITNPSDYSGLGFFKICVLIFAYIGMLVHFAVFFVDKEDLGTVLYIRDQLYGLAILSACIQILDFLSFHYLFGPWAIIIGNLMKDLARFLAVLAIFMIGFSLVMVALNHPIHERREKTAGESVPSTLTGGNDSGILLTPIDAFEMLFFAMFGLADWNDLKIEVLGQPAWTIVLFKIFLAVYLLVSVIVLINLLIAMMSDTYQRIEQQSDIEWKYGLAKLIRNMQITTATASPLNLFVDWGTWLYKRIKIARQPKNKLKWGQGPGQLGELDGPAAGTGGMMEEEKKEEPKKKEAGAPVNIDVKAKWKTAMKANVSKGSDAHMKLSLSQLAPQGIDGMEDSQLSAGGQNRLENVTDWKIISKKYYTLIGKEEPVEEKEGMDKNGSRQISSSQMGSSMMLASRQNL